MKVTKSNLGHAWAKNQINACIFRHNSITSNGKYQYCAFYSPRGNVVVASRDINERHWKIKELTLSGKTKDAHNCICIGLDGKGILHISWDQHGNKLNYIKSLAAEEPLEFSESLPMIDSQESKVTYPEFHRLSNGNLIFAYRDGSSGNGNLVLNEFDIFAQKWRRLHNSLISGEGKRNPYWQICTDQAGGIHISWTWRESPDVATNHDICYAKSNDGGKNWINSCGVQYILPITIKNAEYAAKINQGNELINQTSMFADNKGRPYIASYWKSPNGNAPQYHLVHKVADHWRISQVSNRASNFTLAGKGTKKIPISRPCIIAKSYRGKSRAYIFFRDEERDSKVSVAICQDISAEKMKWNFKDLSNDSVGQWEPSLDKDLWKLTGKISLYVQKVGQGDGETLEEYGPTQAVVYEIQT